MPCISSCLIQETLCSISALRFIEFSFWNGGFHYWLCEYFVPPSGNIWLLIIIVVQVISACTVKYKSSVLVLSNKLNLHALNSKARTWLQYPFWQLFLFVLDLVENFAFLSISFNNRSLRLSSASASSVSSGGCGRLSPSLLANFWRFPKCCLFHLSLPRQRGSFYVSFLFFLSFWISLT